MRFPPALVMNARSLNLYIQYSLPRIKDFDILGISSCSNCNRFTTFYDKQNDFHLLFLVWFILSHFAELPPLQLYDLLYPLNRIMCLHRKVCFFILPYCFAMIIITYLNIEHFVPIQLNTPLTQSFWKLYHYTFKRIKTLYNALCRYIQNQQ